MLLMDFPGGLPTWLHALNAGGLGSIPGQGTRSYTTQLKILRATTKTQWAK